MAARNATSGVLCAEADIASAAAIEATIHILVTFMGFTS
jgi:hypothetical protein